MKKLTNYVSLGVIVTVLAFGFSFAALPNDVEAQTFTTFMRMGVRSAEVLELQRFLNTTSCKVALTGAGSPGLETTYFGPRTDAAVKCFQASRGLLVDGIVGPNTRAALNATVVVGNLPAGCLPGYNFSPLSGQPCVPGGGTNLPAGCTSTAGYSPLTGIKCDSNVGQDDGDPLAGGAGSITVDKTSEFSGEEVGEGSEERGVLSFDIEAEDSDVSITSMRVEFHQGTAADDEDMTDYLESVQVFMDGEMVGEEDMDEFSESNDIYSSNISLSDAVIRENRTVEFSIRVTAQNSIDSADRDTAVVNVGVSSIRFLDGAGVTTTDSFSLDIDDDTVDDTLEESFTFGTFASASNTEFRITRGEGNEEVNEAHVINIDETDETNNVDILSFNVEIRGSSDVNLESLPVRFTVGGAQDNVDEMISGISLWMDGDEIATVSMSSDCVEDGAGCSDVGTMETYFFDDLDLELEAGEEYEFLVKIDIYGDTDTPGDVAPGDTILAEFGEIQTDLVQFDAEDESGDELADGDVTGTVTGEASEVRVSGISVALVSATAVKTAGDAGAMQSDSGLFTITFDVTAFGEDVYIDKTAPDATGGVTESDLEITPATGATGTITSTITSPSGAEEGTEAFVVQEGETERFAITVDIRDGATDLADGFYRVALGSLLYGLTDEDTDGDLVYNTNLETFQTPLIFLDDNE